MTTREFTDRLEQRARLAGVSIVESVQRQLEEYFRLLAHWNSTVNLTALPVRSPTDEAFDRLLIEPLAASNYIPQSAKIWLDLGSGGGSPAIPLKIARPSIRLTMVESTARKAAFLREAARVLQLSDTTVENARFEELIPRAEFRQRFDLVTVRAVRADDSLFSASHALLGRHGRLVMFRSEEGEIPCPDGFRLVDRARLLGSASSYLVSLEAKFHVEQME